MTTNKKAESQDRVIFTGERLGFRHPRVKFLRDLVAKRSKRDEHNAVVVEGLTVLEVARSSGLQIREVFATSDALNLGIEPNHVVEDDVIERIGSTVTPQPVIAIVERPQTTLEDIVSVASPNAAVVVLSDVQDPGNVGTIIRSANASAMAGVICCGQSADPYSPKVVRSTAGSIFQTPVVVAHDMDDVLGQLRDAGFQTFGTRAINATDYDDASLTGRVAIVMGNEAHGLGDAPALDNWVRIPIEGSAESLNVSVAASVICFEIARQRRNLAKGK